MHKYNGNMNFEWFEENIDPVVDLYKDRLREKRVLVRKHIAVEHYFYGDGTLQVDLWCFHIDPNNKPTCFRLNNETGVYQYDARSTIGNRPLAWRVPFYANEYYFNEEYKVSHLCHDKQCYNWRHHTLELLETNKSRNGCPGGLHCHHRVKCIIPGPYYNW